MNAYKLNGMASTVTRKVIVKELGIHHSDIYKHVKSLSFDGVVETHDGKRYQIKMSEIKKIP